MSFTGLQRLVLGEFGDEDPADVLMVKSALEIPVPTAVDVPNARFNCGQRPG